MKPSQPTTTSDRDSSRGVAGASILFSGAVCLASLVHPHHEELQKMNPHRDDPLTGVLGEGRKLFANHFYIKADAYFHSGFYPTIFDNRQSHQTPHIAEDAGVQEGKNTGDEEDFLGEASGWIDKHSRKHFPSVHTHLGEDSPGAAQNHQAHNHDHDHDHDHDHQHDHHEKDSEADSSGTEREILPWLKLSSRLDPNLIETYTVGAYWLRRINKHREAEIFLREGMQANPESAEILFELGRCRFDANDPARARNIWEHSWKLWQKQESGKDPEVQNRFLSSQILLNLARLESKENNRERSLYWLNTALPLAISPDQIKQRIADVEAGRPFEADRPHASAAEHPPEATSQLK
ncbi:MAG: tetratricopeptide repeat protein [Verrucomicrobiales bacterium]|nr:tetratricopeptide repeat protein [Verrucomicrobiales bacterium]